MKLAILLLTLFGISQVFGELMPENDEFESFEAAGIILSIQISLPSTIAQVTEWARHFSSKLNTRVQFSTGAKVILS